MTDNRREVISIYQEDRYTFRSDKRDGDNYNVHPWLRQWLL